VKIDLGEREIMNLSGLESEVCVVLLKRFGGESEWI